jgi:hypothetical protein
MTRGACALSVAVAALLLPLPATAQESYLDVFTCRIKPEKRAEFEAAVKKMVDANRKHAGDAWLAADVSYGEGNTVIFTSGRNGYGEVEKAFESFMGSATKAFGPAGAAKLMQDFNSTLISSRGEMRRRRMDLSRNAPSDLAGINRLVGQSRWVRTTFVRIRPGRTTDYEAQLKVNNEALNRAGSKATVLVSQSSAGQQGTVFFASSLQSSLAGFDAAGPSLPQALGESGYQKYLQVVRDAVLGTESIISRFVPELSNPPDEIASVSPEFWRPKPPAVAPARPKPTQ